MVANLQDVTNDATAPQQSHFENLNNTIELNR